MTSTDLPSSTPVMCARSGPPYCIVHARVGSSGSATAASRSSWSCSHGFDLAAAQLDPDGVRAGARDLDGQSRAAGRRARGGLLVVAAAAGQRGGGEQGGQETGGASHGRTTSARPIRHNRHAGSPHCSDDVDREIVRALRGGPATLDALHARLGAPARDALGWAVDDAVARGWVRSSAGAGGEPDGICSASAPAVLALTPGGRAALRAFA